MAPPIRFALRVRPNLDPAEDLLSDESNVWIAEMPAEELSEAKALPVRLIRTVHRVSSLDAVTLAKLGVYTSAKHAQLYTQSSEAFSMHTDEAGAYPKRMEVAGGGATLFVTLITLPLPSGAVPRFWARGIWSVMRMSWPKLIPYTVSFSHFLFGPDVVFQFSTTIAIGLDDPMRFRTADIRTV